MHTLAIESGHKPHWQYLGWLGVLAGFIILSYYSVIAGWALAYVPRSGFGVFAGATADGVRSIFTGMINQPEVMLGWHTLFMAMTFIVVAKGVRGGLEKAVRILMPSLFILLVVLVGYAMGLGEFMKGVKFLFEPDFSNVTRNGVLVAMGHAFFTLSLGMGAIMVYGSYLPSDASITKTSVTIALADTVVALLAGLAIFPIVFANNLEPGAGPGLIFQTLPLAFGHMPGGTLFGTLFFILLTFAAWTSAISLIEPAVAFLVENKGMNRVRAAAFIGVSCWFLGIVTVLSFNEWAFEFRLFGKTYSNGAFDMLDILTANIMLPLGGLFIAIFAAWFMSRDASHDELNLGENPIYEIWRFLVRYITPPAVIIVFLNVIGII